MRKKGKQSKYTKNSVITFKKIAENMAFEEHEVIALSLPNKMSVQKFTLGTANEDDWNKLAHVSNVCALRGKSIDPQVLKCGQDGQKAVINIYERYKRTLKWGVNHQDLQALIEVVDVYEQLLRLSLPSQMLAAIAETSKQIREGNVIVLLKD